MASQVFLGLTVFLTLPLWPKVPRVFLYGVRGAYDFVLGALAILLITRISYVFWRNRRANNSQLPWFRLYEPHIEALLFFLFVVAVMPWLWKFEATYFVTGELLRILCIFGLLIVPAVLIGLSFPILLNLYSETARSVGGKVL